MKKYPLHITHQLNDTLGVKTRIQMIFKEHSAQVKIWKYTGMLVVLLFGIVVMACQKQPQDLNPLSTLLPKDYHPLRSIRGIVDKREGMFFFKNHHEWHFEIKKPEKVDFILTTSKVKSWPEFQLFNEDNQLLASNYTGNENAIGFSYKFGKAGNYYIRLDDLKDQKTLYIMATHIKTE
ncbi:MAG TPA: hypothetical protein DCS93_36185 [Microscillaceae bacterium]|nr:hypothetical protein [Microscillaceae bacterium]